MIFLEKVAALAATYPSEKCKVVDNAILYGTSENSSEYSDHIIYNPMPEKIIEYLVNSYRRKIPEQLLVIYRAMNGGDMFWVKRYIKKVNRYIPFCPFSIYGVPLVDARERNEPFNISIEDLNRHHDTPNSWLKFGAYYEPKCFSKRRDLYVDTNTTVVYAVDHDSSDCTVLKEWLSIDDCLAFVLDLHTKEYVYRN